MKRRGFLGSVVGAAVAGPSMAKQAIASGLEGLSLGGSGLGIASAGVNMGGYATADGPSEIYDPAGWAQRDLAEFLGRSAADLTRERLDTGVDRLDPDLACMQSLALQAKLRIQRDRNFERNRAQHRNWLERQIQNALKSMAA